MTCLQMKQVLNSAEGRLGVRAVVPSLNRNSRVAIQTLCDRSFGVMGPQLWNSLPAELVNVPSQESFKVKLTNYLLSLPDEPPVSGYPRVHNNTLPEVSRLMTRWSPEM